MGTYDRSPQEMAASAERIYARWTDDELRGAHKRAWRDLKKASEAERVARDADVPRGHRVRASVRTQRAAEAETLLRFESQRRGLELPT